MSDKDFEFRPPAQRRETKQFEPPPWEREAFEELERKKQAETPGIEPQQPAARAEDAAVAAQPAAEAIPAQQDAGKSRGGGVVGGHVEESVVLEMLAGLKNEQPTMQPAIEKVALISAILLGAVGTMLILWGMAALIGSRATGAVGAVGGTILLIFGAGFIGAAVWLTVRTLRQRGVL